MPTPPSGWPRRSWRWRPSAGRGSGERATARAEAQTREQAVLAAANAEAQKTLAAARVRLEATLQTERAKLDAQTRDVAKTAAQRILGRRSLYDSGVFRRWALIGALAFAGVTGLSLCGGARAQADEAAEQKADEAGSDPGGELPEHGAPEIHGKSLALQLLNFAVLVFVLVKFGGPAIGKALAARHQQLKADLGGRLRGARRGRGGSASRRRGSPRWSRR